MSKLLQSLHALRMIGGSGLSSSSAIFDVLLPSAFPCSRLIAFHGQQQQRRPFVHKTTTTTADASVKEAATTKILGKEMANPPLTSVKTVLENGKVGDTVRVQGWVKGLRKQKSFIFLDVSDGLSFHKLPVVVSSELKPAGLSMHCSVDIIGQLSSPPNNPGLLELHPTQDFQVVGSVDQDTYPFAGKSKYTPDYIRQYVHLRPKTRKFGAVLRVRSAVTEAMHQYFRDNEFVYVHTPLTTSNDAEGAGETFKICPDSTELLLDMQKECQRKNPNHQFSPDETFFDKKVHLTVSSQLHLEALTGGLGKVWTLSPSFRAENTRSTRHLAEFYMLEAEIAFAQTLETLLDVMESLVKYCIHKILFDNRNDWDTTSDEDAVLKDLLERILKNPFTIMTFEDAKRLLESRENSKVSDEQGLTREQELLLTEKLNHGIPIFVIDWPHAAKPFYMRRCPYDETKVSAVDLIVPTIGELCGGSLREHRTDVLESSLDRLDPSGKLKESLSWYVDLRKYGGVPSGGFGLGFDRLVQLITGIKTIKDVSPFPRWPHHCAL